MKDFLEINNNKDFLTCEQSLLMKEIGFDESCMAWYDTRQPKVRLNTSHFHSGKWNYLDNAASAPTYSQAFRWFRDKHEIFSSINVNYCYSIYKDDELVEESNDYKNYEEAETACLDKLIKILKNG
jgi:hypothetical protein